MKSPGSAKLGVLVAEAGVSAPESMSSCSCVSFWVASSASSRAVSLCLTALFRRFMRSDLTFSAAACNIHKSIAKR